MKLSTGRYYLICIFLFAPFLIKAQLSKADSLLDVGEYHLASIAYERALYRNEEPKRRNEILLKKTRCLKALGKYENAYNNLIRADLFTNSDSVSFQLRYEIVINAFLAEDYHIADNHMKQLNHFIESSDLKSKIAFLEIITLNEMQKWKEGKNKFVAYNEINNANLNVDSLYSFLKRPKIRNIKKTEGIATVAPGFIQVREGKVFDGIFSASIRGSLIYLVMDQFGKQYFFSGSLIGGALYLVFFKGASKYAMTLTENRNRNKINKYNQRVNYALIKYEMSIINDKLSDQL